MTADTDVSVGLYQRMLGADTHELSPVVQKVHAATGETRGTGTIEVCRLHRLAFLVPRRFGLPPAGAVVALHLTVTRTHDREVWQRSFGEQALVTEQRAGDHGELVERAGPLGLRFMLRVEQGALRFDSVGAVVHVGRWCVPFPRRLAPVAAGTASAAPDGTRLLVHFTFALPVIGPLLDYRVDLQPS